ncbi:unnamed protein product [Protopolystoma xenopodis]|uniref:Uncharacterized protein n=1 Tax=Protopolystoma xenopodis TaxID=117903 RepID=A0A3S5ADH3_9PLAT|nr:unnamed protein product [Protopolystoma xenopodis]
MLVYMHEASLSDLMRPVTPEEIPASLLHRLREERRAEAAKRRAKAEAHLYATLLLILEEDFHGWQVGKGIFHMPRVSLLFQ